MFNDYTLQAKRPFEKVFTEWCSTDDYEVIQKNIKIIESYGYQWQLKEKDRTEKEQMLLHQLRYEVAREIWEEIDVTWSERTGVGEFFENLAELKKKYTEVKDDT
jgi:hypothetical protein